MSAEGASGKSERQVKLTISNKHRSRRKVANRIYKVLDCDMELNESTNKTTCNKFKRPVYLFNSLALTYKFSSVLLMLILIKSIQSSYCLTINVNLASTTNNHNRTATSDSLPTSSFSSNQLRLYKRSTNEQRSAKLQEVDALAYLQRYGYMNGTLGNANLISEDSFNEAVMSFQRFAGIPETGSVDSLTIRYMQMPRCGNKDSQGRGENGRRRRKKRRRRKRYALQGSKWRRQELTYRISQYPTRFMHKKEQVDAQIEKAFKIWSQVAPIEFVVKKEGRVHIDIRFASGEHGDGDPFDGPGNTLAHAYFPQYGGDAHFDDQEYWTVDSYAGTNIFQVAAHELGHSLGLGHSSVREALMAPFYQKYKPNFKLHADDILGIQALYGDKSDESATSTTSTTSTTTPPEPQPSEPSDGRRRAKPVDPPTSSDGGDGFNGGRGSSGPADLCQEPTIDAITRTEDGSTYAFRGQYYWMLEESGVASGYPAKISRDWDGLPGNLDAALTWSDGKTFFFKGDKYWRFFNKRREPGYPKLISSGFAGIPNNVDAAFVWSGNGKTYFIKKDKYWRFDSKQEPPVSSQYPKPLKNWVGLPAKGVDAAFKWKNGVTYFFKDDLYYRFDDRQFEVDTSLRPSFPRSIAEWWFGCENSNLPIRRSPDREVSAENLQDEPISSSGTSLLLFHRRPNLTIEHQAVKPAGNSLSRSLFESLSSFFPFSSSSSNENDDKKHDSFSASSSSVDQSDWSFHRGAAEEARRSSRSAHNSHDHHHYRPTISSSSSTSKNIDTSRWMFPLSSSSLSHREQSLSELKLEPTNSTKTVREFQDEY